MTALSAEPVPSVPASVDEIADVLATATAVTICCHTRPDADTIGSGLALGMALRRRGTAVQVSFPSPAQLPEPLSGLPGVELLVAPEEVTGTDVVVTVDCASVERIGMLAKHFQAASTQIVIDHHVSNAGYGTVNLVDGDSSCTAELILMVLDAMETPLDADLATCLYAGLVTDTGSFKWGGPQSHRTAARLLEAGVDGREWTRRLLDTHQFLWLTMVSKVLATAVLVPEAFGGAGLVYAVVDQVTAAGMSWEQAESVVDIVRTTAEAEVAVVFKETSPNRWSVSMRSKTQIDLVPVARAAGGGGHRHAAGFATEGTADEVVAAFVAAAV